MKTCVIFLALIASINGGRVKRASLTNCNTNPSNMDPRDNVVDDGDTMTLTCNADSKIAACIWRHTDPISEKTQGSQANPTISCTGTPETAGKQCQSDSRLTYRNSDSMCSIDVSNTKPEDTGRWYLTAVVFQANGQGTTDQEHRFEVYTYNQSLVEMVDEDLQIENSIDTSYNWDTKEEEWMSGTGGYERVEFSCMAWGGRPEPVFEWYINNEKDDLTNDDHFSISTTQIGSDFDYIDNFQSTIDFQIDENLLEKLDNYGIDVNPENGQFSFDINCEVLQGNIQATSQRGNSMRINVRRNHDDGQLKGSMIGVIVGVVLAGILLLVAIALLVFAKATDRWCFADSYDDPANAKSHPRSQMGRGGNQQPQVYRDNIDEKKSRKSSTSSNNTTPLKASNATQKNSNGEWLPDSRKSAHNYSATPTLQANLNTTPKQTLKTSAIHSPASSTSSSSTSGNPPPPRPPKDGLQYANLDHRAFMQDPRNRVLPPGSGSLPPSTTYATVKTKEVTQTSSRTFGGTQRM